jgi:hypothetical protein
VRLLALPVHLARYREDGVLRRLRASAAPRWAVFGSQAIVASAIALAGGHAAYGSASRIAHAQQAAWHQVPAVLLATAPAARYRQDQVNAQARWTAPDRTWHTGTVLAPPGTRAGRVVMVWVDIWPAGDRPLQLSQAR